MDRQQLINEIEIELRAAAAAFLADLTAAATAALAFAIEHEEGQYDSRRRSIPR